MIGAALAGLLLLIGPAALAAQEEPAGPAALRPDTVLRVYAPGAGLRALRTRFAGLRGDTLLVRGRAADTLRVPFDRLDRLLVQTRPNRSLRTGLAGAGLGLLIGPLVVYPLLYAQHGRDEYLELAAVVLGGSYGVVFGGVIGALYGLERWDEVRIPGRP